MTTAVAISTTGDAHRLPLLAQSVKGWASTGIDRMFVTVDGDEEAYWMVVAAVGLRVNVYRVGQPLPVALGRHIHEVREGRLGVAVNKNTGIELMMEMTDAEHLFLSDDDIWPLAPESLALHVDQPLDHSMVCWGYHRLGWTSNGPWAEWDWPRGSALYVRRSVVHTVGGMVEAFGPGGHEHVEWSRRIHQRGITPALYPSPLEYAGEDAQHGQVAMRARDFWYSEDMPLPGEPIGNFRLRKNRITSVRRRGDDWKMIEEIMRRRDGITTPAPYRATDNHRGSATLYHNHRA